MRNLIMNMFFLVKKIIRKTTNINLVVFSCKHKLLKLFTLYNYVYFRYLNYVKGYEQLNINNHIKNGIFEVFVFTENGTKVVLKVPRRDTFLSVKFYLKIRRTDGFKDYSDTLKSLESISHLKENVAELVEIYKHGGYKSVYIDGYNLKDITYKILYDDYNFDKSLAKRISKQIKNLIENLEMHNHEFGYIPGDWPLHNLVYDSANDKIINVDLEGFYTYKKDNRENDLSFLKNELYEVLNLLDDDNVIEQVMFSKVLAVVKYTATRSESYCAKDFESAYHSLRIRDKYFRGQRECLERFKNLEYDFTDKCVLDLGCNTGGMLHALSDKIKFGVGIDFSTKCINAANLIKATNQVDNLGFYNFNLENESLRMIKNFLPSKKVNICFLLAVCMWIKNWKEVVVFCSEISKDLLFETNGSEHEQEEQLSFLRTKYSSINLLDDQSTDDPLQKNRKLYLCKP